MDWFKKSDSEVLAIANPIMDSLMEASTRRDFIKHIEDFSDRIKAHFTEEEFQKQCNDYQAKWGCFTEREFFGVTRVGNFANIYWKQSVSKSVDNFLAVLTLSETNGKHVVERAFIDLWEPKN